MLKSTTSWSTDYTTKDISLSHDLRVGEGSEDPLEGADLRSVVEECWSDPEDYAHVSTEEKLHIADVMISRWQEYRARVEAEAAV